MSDERSNPYRADSAMHKLFSALQRANKPLEIGELSKRAGVALARTKTLVAAMRNPFHNSNLRRAGIAVALEKDGYSVKECRADPKAHRPAAKKAGKAKASVKKPAKKMAKPIAKKEKKPTPKAEGAQNPGWTKPEDTTRFEADAPAPAGKQA